MTEIMAFFLALVFLAGILKVYLDWSGFERQVRRAKSVDMSKAKRTGIRIGWVSTVTGLAFGLLAVLVRFSSPTNPPAAQIGGYEFLIYAISCAAGWMLLVILAFVFKVLTLTALYKERNPR